MQTTPQSIDATVLELCERANPVSTPVFVPVQTVAGAEHRDCYANVERMVKEAGGTIEYGWAVWLEPGFLIEAEHHAVWVSPGGVRMDVSPRASETQILFLPGAPPYNNRPIPNIRLGLSAHPRMREYLAIHEQLDELQQRSVTPDGHIILTPQIQDLQMRAGLLQMEMGVVPSVEEMMLELSSLRAAEVPDEPPFENRRVGRNDPCPCGSGKKFKKCHMRR